MKSLIRPIARKINFQTLLGFSRDWSNYHEEIVLQTELRPGEPHGEGQAGVVDWELGLQRQAVGLVWNIHISGYKPDVSSQMISS